MYLSFRWYGVGDPVPLDYIGQIPGVKRIVTALYDVPVGEAWPLDSLENLRDMVEAAGLTLAVIESVPVHEDIKLGRSLRDKYIQNFNQTLQNLSRVGIEVVCYNFMPVFDWTRSSLEFQLLDGSTSLAYDQDIIETMNPQLVGLRLPGWNASYTDVGLMDLMKAYQGLESEQLWDNLAYFLKAVIPVAEASGIKMAIHPDDPPWSIFGIPRIIVDKESLVRVTEIVDSPSNGLCLCTGSLASNPSNDVVELARYFGHIGKVNFVHARNIQLTGERSFYETAHPSSEGIVDMSAIVRALYEAHYTGPLRPDHGRMIWGERGKPGYGLYDRALGCTYLYGLWEATHRTLDY